jgi:hypothetical protein
LLIAKDGHAEPQKATSDDPVATECVVQELLSSPFPPADDEETLIIKVHAVPADDPMTTSQASRNGTVEVNSTPPCSISIDGGAKKNTPVSLQLPAGKHSIVAFSTDGTVQQTTEVEVRAGAETRVALDMKQGQVWHGKKVTIDLQDADLVNTIRLIADVSGKNLALNDGELRGRKMTMKFKNTPWDEALDAIAKTQDLDLTVGAHSITVRPRSHPTP